MGFQVYNSQGQELQNLTGTAGGDLTGTYPNPTIAAGSIVEADIDSTFAQQLGVTNRASTTYAGPSSTQSSTYVDTGASLSLTVSASSVTAVYLSAECRTGNGSGAVGSYKLVAGSADVFGSTYGNTSRSSIFATEQNSTYRRYATLLTVPSAVSGTGTVTFKVQYANLNGNTQDIYIQNCYIYAINLSAA